MCNELIIAHTHTGRPLHPQPSYNWKFLVQRQPVFELSRLLPWFTNAILFFIVCVAIRARTKVKWNASQSQFGCNAPPRHITITMAKCRKHNTNEHRVYNYGKWCFVWFSFGSRFISFISLDWKRWSWPAILTPQCIWSMFLSFFICSMSCLGFSVWFVFCCRHCRAYGWKSAIFQCMARIEDDEVRRVRREHCGVCLLARHQPRLKHDTFASLSTRWVKRIERKELATRHDSQQRTYTTRRWLRTIIFVCECERVWVCFVHLRSMRLPFCKMLIVHWSVCAGSMILHLRLYPFSRTHSIFFIGPILLLLSHTAFILVDNEGKTEANGIANESTEPAISKMKEKKTYTHDQKNESKKANRWDISSILHKKR